MQIVIDIPETEYRLIREVYEKNDIVESIYSYIYHGTPLPKHHGRLIDADKLELDDGYSNYDGYYHKYSRSQIHNAPTIIEGSDSE